MSQLRYEEFSFLSKSLNIGSKTLDKLTEEETDLNLLLESASLKAELTKQLLHTFSPNFCFKLLIFKYSQKTNFPTCDKLYICKATTESYGKLLHGISNGSSEKTVVALRKGKATEESSKCLIVASGLLNTLFKMDFNAISCVEFIEDGFRWYGLEGLSHYVSDWIIILRNIQNDGWLNPEKPKQLQVTN